MTSEDKIMQVITMIQQGSWGMVAQDSADEAEALLQEALYELSEE